MTPIETLAPPPLHVAGTEPEAPAGRPEDPRADGFRLDDWPRTGRLLPWLVALFILMLWTVPFNTIMLNAGGPIDLQLDRLLLPAMAVVWIAAAATGGGFAPKLKITPGHVAFIVFCLLCALSLVVNAGMLNITRELGDGLKQLSVLGAYLTFFVMITSIVRPTEVRAFLKLTFVLAVVCALGTLWEYNFHVNLFYTWTSKIFTALPMFRVTDTGGAVTFDEIGRPLMRGPTQHGLELASMMAMALPIAIVGLMDSPERRRKIGYGIAACLFLAAAISTYRKTAIIAPITALAVLAFFRPRRLLRLAPLALVVFAMIHALSPGALGSIVDQLHPSSFNNVSTVSDRTNDYDAVRPDVFTHPILGRGFGTYSPARYRILDNQLLGLLVQIGVLGLLAYAAVMVTVLLVARDAIRSRDPLRAPPALVAAAAAAVFLVVSQLFDVMAFPHAPYVFLSLAGLAAVTNEHQRAPA
jgi:hypothetical protein